MNVVQIAMVCVGAALICAMLRTQRPEMAMALALAVGVCVLLLCLDELKEAAAAIREFATLANVSGDFIITLLKAAGIALISQFAAELCRDAGESALAGRVELGARLALMVMSLPMIRQILETISEFFQWG